MVKRSIDSKLTALPEGERIVAGLRRHGYVAMVVLLVAVAATFTGAGGPGAGSSLQSGGSGLIGGGTEASSPDTIAPTAEGGADTPGGESSGTALGSTQTTLGPVASQPGAPSPGAQQDASSGGWAPANIFSPKNDRIGLTDTTLNLCIHASLQLGAVFDNTADDFRVYWQMVNDAGGIHGRKVNVSFTDDQYTPQGGAQAAQQCKANNAFVMGGGVGFDTVPAVRQFAEQNDMLYLSSFATERDIAKYSRSFSFVPSIERLGNISGQYAASNFKGKKFGVIWRNSPNWQGGRDQFKAAVAQKGGTVVADVPVQKDQGDYTNAILTLRNAGAEVVLGWVNVLEFTQLAKQANAQNYRPTWVVGGFNLITDTLGHDIDGTNGPPAVGVWVTPPYPADPGADYQPEIDRMLAAFAKYRPSKNGKVNDVDWQVWVYSKQIHQLLQDCGRDCSRNRLAGMMLAGYRTSVPPGCDMDFARGGGRLAGFAIDIFKAVPNGAGARWSSAARCREGF